jgi:hypothetical protein
MANVRITDLPIEVQPLQTDVLPIVNSGVTKQVSIEDVAPVLLKVGSDVFTNFIYTYTAQTTNVLSGSTSGNTPTIQILDDKNPSLRIGAMTGMTMKWDETNTGDFIFSANTNVVITPLSGVTISKNLTTIGNQNISGNTTILGTTNLQNNLSVSGVSRFNNEINVTGTTNLQNTLNISGVTNIYNNLIVSGNTNISGNTTTLGTSVFYDGFGHKVLQTYEGGVSGEVNFPNVVTIGDYDSNKSYLYISTDENDIHNYAKISGNTNGGLKYYSTGFTILNNLQVEIANFTTNQTRVNGTFIINNPITPPVNSGDTGTKGTITYDNDYLYVCINSNTWKRVELLGW